MKLILGDCLEKMKDMEDNSIDSIVTDPPYGISFMDKGWDKGVPPVEVWKECLRVLKPGGHLLSFAGTRTQHRMATNIEDAGFEIRDMIAWVYGCLSEDTEILTESGYKSLRKLTQYDRIGVYDITNNIYKWERPQRYSVYKVHQDTAYRIKSDYTDQIVSRNHRCLVEREGRLVFVTAEELNEMEYMPTLSEDFYSLQKRYWKLLFSDLLRKGKGLVKKLFSKWTGKEMSEQRIEVRKEPSLERWHNLLEETRKLQADKICEVSEGVFTDGEKRWICNGTSFDSVSILGDMFRENSSSASYQSRPTGQPTGKFDVISVKQGTQIIRRARVEKIEYSGIIFCPTVSTGAFVARRNGQVFITGNSGFPKSLNIGKEVDKLQGNERITIEVSNQGSGASRIKLSNHEKGDTGIGYMDGSGKTFEVTKGNSQYEGWGTALKPSLEPITVARKPIEEKTVAENVLKYGTGGINIDGCRVETDEKLKEQKIKGSNGGEIYGKYNLEGIYTPSPQGRWPANLIHDGSKEVTSLFPDSKSTGGSGDKSKGGLGKQIYGKYSLEKHGSNAGGLGDSGSASRFFYCAKASKKDRNEGCDDLEEKQYSHDGRNKPIENAFQRNNSIATNNHPTVKPTNLMRYLVRLVTPKQGTVLDPFMGSGSTGKACILEGFDFIGIDLEEEYIKIAEKRINKAKEIKESSFFITD